MPIRDTFVNMRRKIIYIVNPISGTRSKNSVQNIIATETTKAGIPFRFLSSVADGDYSFLGDAILQEEITDIVIVGGDGTVSRVVDALMKFPVQFGIVPAGSGNGLAYGASIPKATKKALQIIFDNEVHRVDGFRVNKRFACMLCGIGFDAQVAHDFARANRRGLVSYVRKVIRNFFTAKPYSFKIKLGNTSFTTEAYFISIANSNQFGNNFTIAPKASLNDGLVDVVIVADQNKLDLVYNTILQVGGLNALQTKENINKSKSVIYFQTSNVSILNCNDAPIHIDGDPADTERNIDIVVEPVCFKLLANIKSLQI